MWVLTIKLYWNQEVTRKKQNWKRLGLKNFDIMLPIQDLQPFLYRVRPGNNRKFTAGQDVRELFISPGHFLG